MLREYVSAVCQRKRYYWVGIAILLCITMFIPSVHASPRQYDLAVHNGYNDIWSWGASWNGGSVTDPTFNGSILFTNPDGSLSINATTPVDMLLFGISVQNDTIVLSWNTRLGVMFSFAVYFDGAFVDQILTSGNEDPYDHETLTFVKNDTKSGVHIIELRDGTHGFTTIFSYYQEDDWTPSLPPITPESRTVHIYLYSAFDKFGIPFESVLIYVNDTVLQKPEVTLVLGAKYHIVVTDYQNTVLYNIILKIPQNIEDVRIPLAVNSPLGTALVSSSTVGGISTLLGVGYYLRRKKIGDEA